MAAFSRNEHSLVERDCRLDYKLLRTGGVTLYWADRVLAEDLAWLRKEQYAIHEFDGCNWRVEDDFHDEVANALQFPGYYGRNLNAFKECMGDVEVSDDGGMVIVIRNIEAVERHATERRHGLRGTAHLQRSGRRESRCRRVKQLRVFQRTGIASAETTC